MSKHNNANWDHYKVAGREHQGDAIHHDDERREFSGAQAHADQSKQQGPHIPNQERASSPAADRTDDDATSPDAPGEHADDADHVQPELSDDEGYTG